MAAFVAHGTGDGISAPGIKVAADFAAPFGSPFSRVRIASGKPGMGDFRRCGQVDAPNVLALAGMLIAGLAGFRCIDEPFQPGGGRAHVVRPRRSRGRVPVRVDPADNHGQGCGNALLAAAPHADSETRA